MRSRIPGTPSTPATPAGAEHAPPLASYSPSQAVFHGESVELFAPAGAEVLAPSHGRVVVAEGRVILLEHDDGSRTWFDGLVLDPRAIPGAILDTGAVLGTVPSSGGQVKAAHIRWGALSSDGKPQDPRARVVTRSDALLLLAAATFLAGAAAVLLPAENSKPILED